MLSLFRIPSSSTNSLQEIEEQNARIQSFFREVENWKNLEIIYASKLAEIATNLREKEIKSNSKDFYRETSVPNRQSKPESKLKPNCDKNKFINLEFANLLSSIVNNHKVFMNKVNYDILMVNSESANRLLQSTRKIIEDQKSCQKEIISRKEALEKVLNKKEKIRKLKEEEIILQIFMNDSIVETAMDQKIRKKNKIKDLQKESDQYEIKVKESIEEYKKVCEKSNQNLKQFQRNLMDSIKCRVQTLLKLQLHFGTYCKHMSASFEELSGDLIRQYTEEGINWKQLLCKYEFREDDILRRVSEYKAGFMEASIRLITQNVIDQLIEYTKDKEIKIKIKRMIEANDINPEETDEVTRQVKIIKKVMAQPNPDKHSIHIFRSLINKHSKLRMNFVFILQFFRINSQFEIGTGQIGSLDALIDEFIDSCHEYRDSFVLKQLMVLLMTYYVTFEKEGRSQKIYIIHFYKKSPLWRDIEYWQSILVQCIYIEKRNTLKMMLTNDTSPSHLQDFKDAERSAIINQVLMVVRNMIIFEFTEKEVKLFANRFIKLLKQDEKFVKDVNKTIEDAVKEEAKLEGLQKGIVQEFYQEHIFKTIPVLKEKSEEKTTSQILK